MIGVARGTGHSTNPSYSCSFAEFKRASIVPLGLVPGLRKQVPALLIVKNPHLDDGGGF